MREQRKTAIVDLPLHWCKVLSRWLIALAALLLLASPLTEILLHIDNFPRGGQDFELSCFLIVALLCLVLLAAIWGRQVVDRLLGHPATQPHRSWESRLHLLGHSLAAVPMGIPRTQALIVAYAVPLRI